ncbi:hypothetical protein B0T14DRAFT_508051 [Immersiella caudata]|uniref:Uncharacterized protein n=1 Tax=Immersiella caudata TaxID=314043 RepID=A0AA39XHW2_9PEZI|nr:hypothetical protein B0T14DRAFT_508051 [Immersiella caudata]
MSEHQSFDAVIEAWIDHLVEAGGQTAVPSSGTDANASTSLSRRSSICEKEAALHRAPNWPMVRAHITEMKTMPPALQELVVDLKNIIDGRKPLIPNLFQEAMSAGAESRPE